jgi:DNA-directed RNA polymerase specialized sigma24 family protein
MPPSRSTNYIDPIHFTELLISYQFTNDSVLLDRLIRAYFFPLARGVQSKFRFRIDPEDAIQEAVVQCLYQIPHFNPSHPTKHRTSTGQPHRKAFSFFTTCVMNTFRGLHRVESTQARGRMKLQSKLADDELRTNGSSRLRLKMNEFANDEEISL